ncbi:hypothetical protein [Ornithinimicrobium cryptoxanthini]|uniref:hypothetical protein n=1 Tax=Ornithinimicrobium cryptoxanthini TaxID=2934161 RepID=UPI0021192E8B|nr:hypothetical protein [Ornithinimicrobium cryptoxanthini]
MFQRKSKPEQVQESASAVKDKAVAGAGSVLTAVKEAFDGKVAPKASAAAEAASARAAGAADAAKERSSDLRHQAMDATSDLRHQARDKASHARDRAVSGLDHGIDSAVPKGQEAVASMAPKVDHARDVIVDEVLPKLSELLGNLQQSKDELLSRQNGPIATVTGAPKKQKRKGGALIVFGVAAAIGAAVAYYLNSQKKPATDPWATEHHVGGAPGVDTQVRASLADRGTATSGTATTAAAGAGAGGTAAAGLGGTGAGVGSTGSTSGTASDTPIADSLTREAADRAASTRSTDTPDHAGAEASHLLSSEEIDDLAKETPDVKGGTGSGGHAGFGTDFGEMDTATDNAEDAGESVEDATDRKTDLP